MATTTPRFFPRFTAPLPSTNGSAEEWRPIAGWPHEVSDQGRVRRSNPGGPNTWTGRVLAPQVDRCGYATVHLRDQGRDKVAKVHRLVALAFLGAPELGREQVNHLNTDKQDNRPENLQWVSGLENQRHAARHGLRPRGRQIHSAKLTPEAVRVIRQRVAGGESRAAVAESLKLSACTVGQVASRRTWSWVT